MEAATIDLLSGGRFELDIGTGWIEEQYKIAGLSYDSPRTRVDRFEEAINVIKGCWSGEPFTFTGDHYQVKDLIGPEPEQQPHPPLLIAGVVRVFLHWIPGGGSGLGDPCSRTSSRHISTTVFSSRAGAHIARAISKKGGPVDLRREALPVCHTRFGGEAIT